MFVGRGKILVMRILSIQSSVAYGHVGNSAAVFPLQRIGVEVMPVYTVCFSNHTGYGAWRGPHLSGDDVREIVLGVEERGGLENVDAVLSGYQGASDIGDAILEAVARVKKASPDAVYACDPVLGNAKSGCFVSSEVQELIRDRVVGYADVITPNQYELGFITGTEPRTLDETVAAAQRAREMGPETVLVTSVERPDRVPGTIEQLVVNGSGAWLIATPFLPFKANGSGDVTAALFTAHLLSLKDPGLALQKTTASVFELLENTLSSGERELRLVQSGDCFANPRDRFTAQKVS